MILSLASAVMALVYLLSFVAADDQLKGMMTTDDNKKRGTMQGGGNVPAGERTNTTKVKHNNIVVSNTTIPLSMADRVQLAQSIKELLVNNPEAGEARNLSTGDLVSLLTRVGTSPELFSSTANIISAVRNGDSSSLVAYLLTAKRFAATSTVSGVAPVKVVSTASAAALPATLTSVVNLTTFGCHFVSTQSRIYRDIECD